MEQSNDQPQFVNNTDFWESEINGDTARLNDLASVAITDICLPTPTNNRLDKAEKFKKIRDFYVEFRRLYYNAEQIIDEETRKKIDKCLNESEKDIGNVDLLRKSINLARELQWTFEQYGLKRIDAPRTSRYPYGFHRRFK